MKTKLRFYNVFFSGLLALSLAACGGNNAQNNGEVPNPSINKDCGNGIVETGETCDDANLAAGDGCDASCQVENQNPAQPVCGNGIVDAGETCDDANANNGDGCNKSCQPEVGPQPVCGNGKVQQGEACDDGNKIDNDACSNACAPFTAEEHVWSKGFIQTEGTIEHFKLQRDTDGNLYVAGDFIGNIRFGDTLLVNGGSNGGFTAPRDIFIAKFDSKGNPLWSKSFPTINEQNLQSFVIDAQGNLLISGTYNNDNWDGIKLNFTDQPALALTDQEAKNSSAYLAKFDKDGNHLWSKSFQSATTGNAFAATNASGEIYLFGDFSSSPLNFGGGNLLVQDSRDFFLAKLSSNGDHIFSKAFAGFDFQYAKGLVVDAAGNPIVIGDFLGNVTFDGSQFNNPDPVNRHSLVVKFNPQGVFQWGKSFGANAGTAEATSLIANDENRVFVAGHCDAPFSVDGQNVCEAGSPNSFFLALAPNGSLVQGFSLPKQWISQIALNKIHDPILLGEAATLPDSIHIGDFEIDAGGPDPVYAVQLGSTFGKIWDFSYENNVPYGQGINQQAIAGEDSELILAGNFNGQLSFGGELLQDPNSPQEIGVPSFYLVLVNPPQE